MRKRTRRRRPRAEAVFAHDHVEHGNAGAHRVGVSRFVGTRPRPIGGRRRGSPEKGRGRPVKARPLEVAAGWRAADRSADVRGERRPAKKRRASTLGRRSVDAGCEPEAASRGKSEREGVPDRERSGTPHDTDRWRSIDAVSRSNRVQPTLGACRRFFVAAKSGYVDVSSRRRDATIRRGEAFEVRGRVGRLAAAGAER